MKQQHVVHATWTASSHDSTCNNEMEKLNHDKNHDNPPFFPTRKTIFSKQGNRGYSKDENDFLELRNTVPEHF